MLSKALTDQLETFYAASLFAQPYSASPPIQIAALVAQGNAVLTALQAGLASTGPVLDAGAMPAAPAAMVTSLQNMLATSDDAVTLCDLRGFLGRAVLNLSQAQV